MLFKLVSFLGVIAVLACAKVFMPVFQWSNIPMKSKAEGTSRPLTAPWGDWSRVSAVFAPLYAVSDRMFPQEPSKDIPVFQVSCVTEPRIRPAPSSGSKKAAVISLVTQCIQVDLRKLDVVLFTGL